MRKTLDELKDCKLFNNFGFNPISDCLQRPFVILSENLVKNSQYYSILFNDYKLGILNSDFITFFQNNTKLSLGTYITGDYIIGQDTNFSEDIKSLIDNNKYIILLINTRFLSCENNTNIHPHWVLLKGYDFDDPDNKKYIIIDEDRDKTHFQGIDITNEMPYIEQSIDEIELKKCCIAINELGWFKKINTSNNDKAYAYMDISHDCNSISEIDIETIFNQYKSYLKELIEKLPFYEKRYSDEIAFISNYYSGKLPKEVNDRVWVFDDEIKTIVCHRSSLKFQKKFFELTLQECKQKAKLIELFEMNLLNYNQAFNMIYKSAFTKDIKALNSSQKYLNNISINESLLYNYILELLGNSHLTQNVEKSFFEIIIEGI